MKKSTFSLLASVCLLLCLGEFAAAQPASVALEGLLQRPGLWQSAGPEIEAELMPMGFVWTSAAKDVLRAAHPKLTLGGLKIYECLLRFRNGRPDALTVIFYNRGDAGDLGKEGFDAKLQEVQTMLSGLIGSSPVERGRDATSAVRAQGVLWKNPDSVSTLEWSVTKELKSKNIPFRAEFIRLVHEPVGTATAKIGATPPPSVKDVVKSFTGRDKIEKNAEGDVFLPSVPMVDQGQKGYCVVASVERVMRYFGAEVDQHELAQIANTKTDGGTSPAAMVDSLKKLTMRLGVKVKEVHPFDFSDFLKMVEDYNRQAKREKLPPVQMGSRVVDIDDCYRQMNIDILRSLKRKKSADFGKFQRDIQRSIDEGIPLLWSVKLGLVPESGIPQTAGGHMRLITGYNPTTSELIYSDSWGMGHEKKKMSMEDAWVITTSIAVIQPTGT